MGQRLNIEIRHEGKTIANCYYHWSAYTIPAANLVNEIIEEYDRIMDSTDPHDRLLKSSPELLAIRLLEKTGAGLQQLEEPTRIQKEKQTAFVDMIINPACSRNDGLISVSYEGMDETRMWEEGHVDIDLGEEVVWFDVFDAYTKDEWCDEYGDDEYENLHVEQGVNFSEIPFHEFWYIEDLFSTYSDFRTPEGDVYSEIC